MLKSYQCQNEFTSRIFLEDAAPIPLVSSQVTQEEIIDDGQAERDGRSLLAHKFPMEAVARHSHGGRKNSHAGHSGRRTAGRQRTLNTNEVITIRYLLNLKGNYFNRNRRAKERCPI